MDIWQEVDAERRELASVLSGLEPAQWDVPSLCRGWLLRHVVAHLVAATTYTPLTLFKVALAGFNLNRFIEQDALRQGARSPGELLEQFRAIAGSRGHPPGTKPINVLCDTVLHRQDIQVPLGVQSASPTERLLAVGDFLIGGAPGSPIPSKLLARGLRFEATDAEWAAGSGALVSGPLSALVLALSGRSAGLAQLSGEGLGGLVQRTQAQAPAAAQAA